MTYTDVSEMLSRIGVPTAYYQFTRKTAQPPPFICYYYERGDDDYADDKNYQRIRPLVVELYTDTKDFDMEKRVEDALNEAGLAYEREETSIDSERLYLCSFYSTVVITEEG